MKNLFRKSKVVVTAVLAAALLSGCGDSDNFVFTDTNTNNGVVAPVAVDDNFQALGNATLQQAASGVLANDTVNGATITSFDAAGNQGGTLDLNADGSFTYTPATDFQGAETFSYTLGNDGGESTATLTLTSTGLGRFVDNSGANGTGTQASPFDNLAAALAAAQPGDVIYVARGDGTNTGMTGGFTLPAGVNLVGEGTGLILGQTIEPAGTSPTMEGPIVCLGDNVIQGVTIDGGAGSLIQIDTVGNVTIDNCTIDNPGGGQKHVDVHDVSGTLTITNNTFETSTTDADDYVYIDNDGVSCTVLATDNSFANTSGNDFDSCFELDTADDAGNCTVDVTYSRNLHNGSNANRLHYGFYWDSEEETGVTATVNCSDNTFSFTTDDVISTYDVTGTISGNMITDTNGQEAIYCSITNGTMAVTGNVIANAEYGFYGYYNDGAGTYVLSNNNITDSDRYGIYIEDDDDNNAKVAMRNNTITNAATNSIYIEWDGNTGFDLCCDIIGNTVNNDMAFDDGDDADLIVERFGNTTPGPNLGDELKTVNTFNGGATVTLEDQAVVDVAAGTCAIP